MADPQPRTQTVSVAQAFAVAQRKHAEGATGIARKIYEQIATAAPDHAEAAVMLASLAYREGRESEGRAQLERGIDLARASVQRKPEDIAARAAVVNLLLASGRIGEAEAMIGTLDLALNPIRATAEEFEARRAAGLGKGIPSIVITTLPKSASESIWNKLAEGLGIAQCYLSLGLFPDCCLIPSRVSAVGQGGVSTKEHIAPTRHNLATLKAAGINRIVVHHRDPRQATLSWAHFARDDVTRRLMAPLWRKIMPPADVIARDLEGQIDWCIDRYMPFLIEFLADWRAVAADPAGGFKVLFESFEAFRGDADGYCERVLDFYEIPRERFAADAQAATIHLRKGEIDEWRSVFTAAQRERAWSLIPRDMADAFGWEP